MDKKKKKKEELLGWRRPWYLLLVVFVMKTHIILSKNSVKVSFIKFWKQYLWIFYFRLL